MTIALDEWNLKIVGTGDPEKYYKKLVGQLGNTTDFFSREYTESIVVL